MSMQPYWKKILVPTDFSESSLSAVSEARRYLQFSQAEVVLLHVTEPAVVRHASCNLDEIIEAGQASKARTALWLLAGLAMLIGAAQFVVHGGNGVAEVLGWSPFIVGAVVVAVATGTPELATTIVSRIRGHHDVGLGNILGSNVFNALFIAALVALIQPYVVRPPELVSSLAFGSVTTLMILPCKGGYLGRWRGFVLLALYVVYVAMTLRAGGTAH